MARVAALMSGLVVSWIASPVTAADHVDGSIWTGDFIDASRKVSAIGPVYVDGNGAIFQVTDDLGIPHFGFAASGFGFPKIGIDWHSVDLLPLGDATASFDEAPATPSFAFLADDAGTRKIFGVADLYNWSTTELVFEGQDLGGSLVGEIGAFDLSDRKLLFHVKKGGAGGEGVYVRDLTSGVTTLLAETGTSLPDGDITHFGDVSTDGKKALIQAAYASAAAGEVEGIFLSDDLMGGTGFTTVVDATEVIPGTTSTLYFKFTDISYNGKKATFAGEAGTISGIFFDASPGEHKIQPVATTLDLVPGTSEGFASFESFSVRGDEVAFVANGTGGSRAAYAEEVGKAAKRVFGDGDILKTGQKLATFSMTSQSIGSLTATGSLTDGSQAILYAPNASLIPALPAQGIFLLLLVAGFAVLLQLRSSRAARRV